MKKRTIVIVFFLCLITMSILYILFIKDREKDYSKISQKLYSELFDINHEYKLTDIYTVIETKEFKKAGNEGKKILLQQVLEQLKENGTIKEYQMSFGYGISTVTVSFPNGQTTTIPIGGFNKLQD